MKRKYQLVVVSCLSALLMNAAQAEFSLGSLFGYGLYTSKVRGDALFAYGGDYYQYPSDITSSDFAAGILARYVYPIYPCLNIGGEFGYIWINQDTTYLRANALLPNPIDVENISIQSTGVILLNFIIRLRLTPSLNVHLFGGPAWLNTKYRDNDFYDHYSQSTASTYQLTGDLGIESNWNMTPCLSFGMRFDYIFNTNNRIIATHGSVLTPLNHKLTANSSLSLFTATVRWLIPNT